MATKRLDGTTHFESDVAAGARDANANFPVLKGAATGADPLIEPDGDDANAGLIIRGKGTGIASAAIVTIFEDTGAAVGQFDAWFFVAPRKLRVIDVREVHAVAGTDAGAVTAQLTKVTSGQAPLAGVAVLAATVDLKAAANTPVNPALTTTDANRVLAAGNGLAIDFTGVFTSLRGVIVIVTLVPEP